MTDLVVELLSASTDARIADLAAILDDAAQAFSEAKVAEAGRNPPFVRFVHGLSRARHTCDQTSGYVDLELSFGRNRLNLSFLDLATVSTGARGLDPDPDASYDASKATLRRLLDVARTVVHAACDPARTSRRPEAASTIRHAAARTRAVAVAIASTRPDLDIAAGVVCTAPGPWAGPSAEGLVAAVDDGSPWRAVCDDATLRRWWSGIPTVARAIIGEPPTSRDGWTVNIQTVHEDWRGEEGAVERLRLLADLPQEDAA